VFYSTALSIQDFRFRVQSWFPGSTVEKYCAYVYVQRQLTYWSFQASSQIAWLLPRVKSMWMIGALPSKDNRDFSTVTALVRQSPHRNKYMLPSHLVNFIEMFFTSLLKITTPPASLSLWRLRDKMITSSEFYYFW
jgi:hypothetical protein